MTAGLRLRRPTEGDYPAIADRIDDWWDGRHVRYLLPRLWLQHFTGSSWIAEADDDRSAELAGFLVGFISPDRPTEAYVHLIGVDPGRRRTGIGAALYGRFFDDVRARGAARVTAITWPGNRRAVAFHLAMGFRAADGEGTARLYGSPAYPAYELDEDRVVFERDL